VTARRLVIALLALAAVAVAPAAQAALRTVKLRDRASGFTVKAPRGYKLHNTGGVYTISNGRATLVLVRLRSTASAAATGQELARALTGRAAGAGSASRFSARVTVAGRRQVLGVRRAGSFLIVTTIRDTKKGGAHAAPPQARAALTAADIAALQRAAGTAAGGQAATLSSTLPTKQFVAPDNGSRALVPAGGDWQYKGGGGQIIAGSARLGAAISLGLPFIVNNPGLLPFQVTPGYPTAPYTGDPFAAIQNVIPAYFNGQGGDVRSLRIVANLAPGLAAPAPLNAAAYVAFTAVVGGKPSQGIMYAAIQEPQTFFAWSIYFSFIVVPQGSDPRIFNTLLRTWQSWDPSADQRRRIADTYRTLASIDYSGAGPIDDKVFSEAAAKWDAYIRGPEA
jgi:hypothetical protein